MGVLQPLEQIQFLSHPVSPHQLLVHLFDRDGAFSSPVIATLDDREAPPGGYTNKKDTGGLRCIPHSASENVDWVRVDGVTFPVRPLRCSETQSCLSSSL